jgi:hypothetical protein
LCEHLCASNFYSHHPLPWACYKSPQETQMRRTRANPRQPPARHWMPVWTAKAAHLARQRGTGRSHEGHTDLHRSPRPLRSHRLHCQGEVACNKEMRAFERLGLHEVTLQPRSNRKAEGAAKRATSCSAPSTSRGVVTAGKTLAPAAKAVEPRTNLAVAAKRIPEAHCRAKKGRRGHYQNISTTFFGNMGHTRTSFRPHHRRRIKTIASPSTRCVKQEIKPLHC